MAAAGQPVAAIAFVCYVKRIKPRMTMRPVQKGRPGIQTKDLIFYEHGMSHGRRTASALLECNQFNAAIAKASLQLDEFYNYSWQCRIKFENGLIGSIITGLSVPGDYAIFGNCRKPVYEALFDKHPQFSDGPRRFSVRELDDFLERAGDLPPIVDPEYNESPVEEIDAPDAAIDNIPEWHRKLAGSFLFTDGCWDRNLKLVPVDIDVYESLIPDLNFHRRVDRDASLERPILALNKWCENHCSSGYAWCGFHPTWAFENSADAALFSAHLETISSSFDTNPRTIA